jgi:hypothetical protein
VTCAFPCTHAALSGRVHLLSTFPGSVRIFSLTKSGWSVSTGPSIKPMTISALPFVSFVT